MKTRTLLNLLIIIILASISGTIRAQQFVDATSTYGLNAITAGRAQTAWADYDNDGKLEFIITGDKTTPYSAIFKQNASGVYQDVANTAVPGGLSQVWISSVAWADYNNDGWLDFVILGTKSTTTSGAYPGITELYRNNGDGTFTKAGAEINVTLAAMQAGTVAWADFNNDGYKDLFIQGRITCSSGSGFPYNNGSAATARLSRIYMNNGNGTFYENTTYTTSIGGYGDYFNANLIDYDNDGFIDIYLFGYFNTNKLIRNNGDGTYKDKGAVGTTTLSSGSSAWGDYNNDSYLDVTQAKGVSWAATTMNFFSGSKTGVFTDLSTTNSFASLDGTGRMLFVDYNNDGNQDVIVSGNSVFKMMANRGAAKGFVLADTTTTLGATFTGVYGGTVQMLDINNDNKLDIYEAGATTANGVGVAQIFLNNGTSENVAPSTPTNLSYVPTTGDTVIIKWDKATDSESSRLTYDLRIGTTPGGSQIFKPDYNFTTNFRKIPKEGLIRDTSTVANSQVAFKIKNLPAGTYYWSVQAIDGNLRGGNWSSESTFTITATQASNIIASNITATGMSLSWTNGNYANRAVFMKQGISGMPCIPDTLITANSAFGTATTNFRSTGWYCVYAGSGSTVDITGLTANAVYTVAVMEYNGKNYNRSIAIDNLVRLSTYLTPTTPATNVSFSSITATQFTASWTNGDGSTRAVFIYKGNTGTASPVKNKTYTANTVYGLGSQIGSTGWYCVYNGTGTSVTVTGLSEKTTYSVMVCEYNGVAGVENYLTTTGTGNPATTSTISAISTQASSIQIIAGSNQFDALWTKGNGTKRVAFICQGNTGAPTVNDNQTYTANTVFGQGTEAGTGWYCVYNGTDSVVTITGLTLNTIYRLVVHEYNGTTGLEKYLTSTASGNPFDQATSSKLQQVITFEALPAKTVVDVPFDLTATGGPSGNPVTFTSSNNSVATISGNTVTIVGEGTTNITANQAGNTEYADATPKIQALTVTRVAQTITFNALSAKSYGDAAFDLTATGGASGNPITFTSSNTSVAMVSGNTVTIISIGSANITANQAGNATYADAVPVVQALTVGKGAQTITFTAPGTKTYGNARFKLQATGGGSGNPITFVSANTAVATISNDTVTILAAGTSNITASQVGNINYNDATPAVQLLTVNKASQTITFKVLSSKKTTDPVDTLKATTSSGLPITYTSSNTKVAMVSGNIVTIMGAGNANITAAQAGNTNYNAATNVVQGLMVNKVGQTIAFDPLSTKAIGDVNFRLTATASSNKAISYSSSDTLVAKIFDTDSIKIIGEGVTYITATQAGDTIFLAAMPVQRTLTVSKTTGINPLADANVRIFPNPAHDMITILLGQPGGKATVGVYSITGRLMIETTLASQQDDIDISSLEPGIYIFKIVAPGGVIIWQVVKQ